MNFIRNQYNYKYYLLEKSIEVGDNLMKKLDSIDSPLSKKVKDFLTSNDISDKADITKIEYDDTDNKVFTIVDERGGERKLKFGKLLKYLGYDSFDKIKGYEIENFILNFKKSNESDNLQLRKGDDILKSYLCDNYDKLSGYGGLGHSCMRFKTSQEYLKIYTENPDKVSCLTLINPDNNKVRGRALIWKLDNGKYYMDRIYVSNNEFKSIFLEYAEKNDIETSSPSDNVTLSNNKEYEFYPYMDTFIHYTPDTGVLSDTHGDITLQSTTGGHSGDTVWSGMYEEEISRDEAVFSEQYSDFIYRHDAIEVYTTIDPEDHTRSETSYVFNNSEDYHILDYASEKYSKYVGEEIINDLLVELEEGDAYVLVDDEKAYTDGGWGPYLKEEAFDSDEFEIEFFAKLVTWKEDSDYGDHVPYSNVTSIWNKEENKIVIATHDNVLSFSFNRGQEVQDDYDSEEDYVEIEIEMTNDKDIKKFTETIYLPESFFDDVDKLIFSSKSPVYKNINGDLEIKDIDTINIHDGVYLTKKEVEKYTVKTPSGPKIYPTLVDNIAFDSFEDIKNYYIENKKLPNENESRMFRSFNQGSILEKELIRIVDGGIQVFDSFKSYSKGSWKKTDAEKSELEDLISYASKELGYKLDGIPYSLISLLGFYDYNYNENNKNGIKVFPFLTKGDRHLVKRYGKYFLYTPNQISNFIQHGAI